MALVVQLRIADVANVLSQVLPDAVGQRLHVSIVSKLLHQVTTRLKSLKVIVARLRDVLPINRSFKMVEKASVTFPLAVGTHLTHALPHLQAVVLELDLSYATINQAFDHFADRPAKLSGLILYSTQNPENVPYEASQSSEYHLSVCLI